MIKYTNKLLNIQVYFYIFYIFIINKKLNYYETVRIKANY